MTVTAFYVSNVEQYLFRDDGAWERFYGNVSSLPIDSTSHFIRSVPRTSGFGPMMSYGSASRAGQLAPSYSRFIAGRDSMGRLTIQAIRDSAGVTVRQTIVDSTRRDSVAAAIPFGRDSIKTGRAIEFRIAKDTVTSVRVDSIIPRDSLASVLKSRRDSINRITSWVVAGPTMSVVMGGLLTSGVAPIQGTLKSFFAGELKTYNSVIEMTRINQR